MISVHSLPLVVDSDMQRLWNGIWRVITGSHSRGRYRFCGVLGAVSRLGPGVELAHDISIMRILACLWFGLSGKVEGGVSGKVIIACSI